MEIEKAANILENAKNPVFLAGLGAIDADAGKLIAKLAERYSAPVACVFNHNDAFLGITRSMLGRSDIRARRRRCG